MASVFQIKLELQRYEFARKTVAERGKLNPVTRQSLEVSFLDTAHIVFTTLSSAGVAALDASSRYDVLVVDEAAQAVELSTIIPMKYAVRRAGPAPTVMRSDKVLLPALVAPFAGLEAASVSLSAIPSSCRRQSSPVLAASRCTNAVCSRGSRAADTLYICCERSIEGMSGFFHSAPVRDVCGSFHPHTSCSCPPATR